MKRAMTEAKTDSAICGYVVVVDEIAQTDVQANKQTISTDFVRACTLRRGAAVCVWGVLYPMSVVRKERLKFEYIEREDVYWNAVISLYIRSATFLGNEMYYYRKRPYQLSANCADKLHFATSLFIAAGSVRNFCNNHLNLTSEQRGKLIVQRRRCINAAYYELYQDYIKETEFQKEHCRKSRFSIRQILEAKLSGGQRLRELLFQFAPGAESQTIYNLMFSIREWLKV